MRPMIALFNFTIRQTLLNRKLWLTVLMLAAPCVLVAVVRSVAPPFDTAKELWEMYHVLAQFMLIMGLVPLICMVHGTSLIGADVENRTVVYLITRRTRRSTVLLVKFAATALVLAVLCDLAMLGLHLCAFSAVQMESLIIPSRLSDWDPAGDLRCYLLIIPLAVVGFLAIFNLIGLVSSRPLGISVGYLVVFELILSNLPVRARVYSLLHQLRVMMADAMPRVINLYELPRELREELYGQGANAVPELLAIVLGALILSAALITIRELTPTRMSRE